MLKPGSLVIMAFLLCSFGEITKQEIVATINKTEVKYDSTAQELNWTSGMNIDADGSPRAYHPISDSGSDALANAGHKGQWWGIVTNKKGEPYVQGKDDPAPGFYISCTALIDRTKNDTDCARYVNSDSIPYIVIPSNTEMRKYAKLGDIARVKNLRNGKTSYAICADIGPKDKIGEGSIFLANQLGINSSPRKGGVADSVSYEIYTGSGNGQPRSRAVIDSIGRSRE